MPLVAVGGYSLGLRSTLVATRQMCQWNDVAPQRLSSCILLDASNQSFQTGQCKAWNGMAGFQPFSEVISFLPLLGACFLALLPNVPFVLEGGTLAWHHAFATGVHQ